MTAMLTGETFAASLLAKATVCSSTSPSKHFCTRPSLTASSPRKMSEDIRSIMALPVPIIRGRRKEVPYSATRPRLEKAHENLAALFANRMSHVSTQARPIPATGPLIAANTGLESCCAMRNERVSGWGADHCSLLWLPDMLSPLDAEMELSISISAPAQKPRPAPVTTTTRMSSSWSNASNASNNSLWSWRVHAFSRSGRFKVTIPTGPSFTVSTSVINIGLWKVRNNKALS
mmetsp:Transcript_134889/g.262700  ORF Transcript_134889/g.262700 Transcript_134889/m.262700 type:complete len:233 (+) Transcript_134889:311-1009(+)